jgi:exodeoxyribonuclease V beta subunit
LPFQQRVLLEASAGTGKTFSLTSLVARYVAEEDLKIDQLLMVTFTNAAANEMRERTRAKLSDALSALEANKSPDLVKQEDIWMKNIVDCTGEVRENRKIRLRSAISSIDSATIATIHGFFQQALREVGLRSADTAGSEVAQGKDTLGKQILRDELVTMFSKGQVNLMSALPDKTPNDLEKAIHEIIKGLNSNISATAAPDRDADPKAIEWSSFVNQIRQKIHDQRISSGTLSFDDLITGLRDLLKPENPLSQDVIDGMRSRYRLVLIDEFQDTDDTQWDIFSKIFDVEYLKSQQGTIRTNETFLAMIMVGDPKQAIYRFRGADIAAYLKVVEDSRLERFEMKRNFRSDRNLITGLNRLFQGQEGADNEYEGFKFGNKNIAFIQVDAAKKGAGSGLSIAGHENESKALQFRWIPTDAKPTPIVKVLRPRIAEDLCNHVALLLNKGTIPDKRDGEAIDRKVQPGDISILVRTHIDAEPIVEALRARNIPVVKSNVGSVSQSEAVDQLRSLLSAMASPNDSRRVKALALTWFVGYSFEDLLVEKKIRDLTIRCNEWAKKLVELGIVGFYQTLRSEESVVASISFSVEAERRLTDLEHLAELLHNRTSGKKLTAASVLRYLDELAGEDDESDEMLRRIDSDAKAIQITTMHASKGLEYPIVLIPFPKAPNNKGAQVFTYGNRRLVNASPHIDWEMGDLNKETRKAIAQEEIEGDDLRLMYVAFTRAKHQLVVWWANSKGMATSPLARLLFGDHEDITNPTEIKDGEEARNRFNEIRTQIGLDDDGQHIMHVTELSLNDVPRVPLDLEKHTDQIVGESSDFPPQAVRNWNWRRWSFTSLSSSLKNEESDSHRGGSDEGETTESAVSVVESGSDYSGPGLFQMPAGAEFGTLAHEVLEKVSFTSSTLKEDLVEIISEYGPETLRDINIDHLAQGLVDSLYTPIDPLVPGFQLLDLETRDRLSEMAFHFTLAQSEVSARQIALVAADDESSPFTEYFRQLAQKWSTDGGRSIAGLMTGSIDLMFRVRSGDRHKYFVVDYKSNRLHTPGGNISHSSYGVDSMNKAMEEGHYPLQALFYCVALHRFLSMRVNDYNIDQDLGGAGYLFLRGMVGLETPLVNGIRNGVLAWRPSTNTILKVNSLLGGEVR